MKTILIASKNPAAHAAISSAMEGKHSIESASRREDCMEKFRRKRHEFFFIDIDLLREFMTDNSYKTALQPFWHHYPTIEIIVMSPPDLIRDAVRVVKAGASNYLTVPFSADEVKYVTESIYESRIMQSELDYLRDHFWQSDSLEVVQTRNRQMKNVFDKIRSVAPTRSTVLLTGETGTGKGVLARLIHRHSNRKEMPFISVHCGAIPDTLLESELFGHEKGAFTGAVRRKLGKFEIAKEGSIFLDEIGNVTPSAQIKLLQILQDGIFYRVGGEAPIEADVRVIAATNIDLKKMCTEGQFRTDLFYRLNVFPIEIPPLRERMEDIPHIINVILDRLNKFQTFERHDIHPEVMEAFMLYGWPGNIRELENLMERANILETSAILTPESFPSELFSSENFQPQLNLDTSMTLAEVRNAGVEQIERQYLKELLAEKKGSIKETALSAGISSRQLHKLLKKLDLRKEDFK